MQKPSVTEIQVRMDCNGCVQKIKKALHGINGIYDLYIDFSQQKLTIIGWADPEKIVKAIRKTRKIATICSHTEQQEPSDQPTEQTPEGGAPPPADGENPPPPEAPPAEAPQPGEPPKDPPPPENPAPPENPPPPEVKPSPIAADTNANQQAGPSSSKEIGEVHVIHHHPPDYGYRYGYPQSYPGHWNRYPSGQVFQHEAPQPILVSHSYNAYKPSPYVTEYEYVRSPPRYSNYSRMDHYSEDYHNSNVYQSNSYGNGNGNGNITSMFSDENPNACRIM
ncbi:hypothetical protein ACOSQ3_007439 [Xanthoceras sorbifolium]